MSDFVPPGSSPRRIRLINVVAALQNLYAAGRMSRAELARRLGLNRSSSGQIVAELAQGGLLREVAETPDPREVAARSAGRPGILLELVPEAAFFVGIEIGVEHISTVTIDLAGRVRNHRNAAFATKSATVEQAVAGAIALGFGAMTPEMIARCQGVGVSAPMHIRPDGTVAILPQIGWRDLALVQIVQAALPRRLPIMIENDANAFAIGDSYKRGPSGVTLFLLLETGVGGGILIDGKLFRGSHGLAGEIGHILVPGSGGASLEQSIGRGALIERYRAASGNAAAGLDDFLGGVRDREPAAIAIAEDWARHLAFTLSQACKLIDPGRVVLGGSVAALYPLVSARVALHMGTKQEVRFPGTQTAVTFPAPAIVVDDDAEFGSAFGVACLLHQRFLSLENESLAADPPGRDEAGRPAPTPESIPE